MALQSFVIVFAIRHLCLRTLYDFPCVYFDSDIFLIAHSKLSNSAFVLTDIGRRVQTYILRLSSNEECRVPYLMCNIGPRSSCLFCLFNVVLS